MSCYLFERWMSDSTMSAFDERVDTARAALHGWSDAKVRRVERYLRRISELARSRKWAIELEIRLPSLFLSRITEAERLAVNILRLSAIGIDDDADRDPIAEDHTRLCVIQAAQAAKSAAAPEVETAAAYRKGQVAKAKKPRGRVGDAGESMDALIKRVVRSHPDMDAIELWPHLGSAISEVTDDGGCIEKHKGRRKGPEGAFYEYDSPKSKKGVTTIGYPTFRDKVSAIRNEKRPD